MRSYKYRLYVSIDLDPWFCFIETDNLFQFLVAIFKNRNNQLDIHCKTQIRKKR